MAKFIVSQDVAILDRGIGTINRFVAIDGVSVDEYGSLDDTSLQLAKRALSHEAIRQGGVRIHQSNCVDISNAGVEASDDMIAVFNGGDIIYTSMHSGFAMEKFMIKNRMLLPASKFNI